MPLVTTRQNYNVQLAYAIRPRMLQLLRLLSDFGYEICNAPLSHSASVKSASQGCLQSSWKLSPLASLVEVNPSQVRTFYSRKHWVQLLVVSPHLPPHSLENTVPTALHTVSIILLILWIRLFSRRSPFLFEPRMKCLVAKCNDQPWVNPTHTLIYSAKARIHHVNMEKCQSQQIGTAKTEAPSHKTRAGIWSWPVALLGSKD